MTRSEPKHSLANKAAFALMLTAVILTTVAYGAVHQPILALFYVVVAVTSLLRIADFYSTGRLRYSRDKIQIPLLAASVYALIQTVPFGSALIDGVNDIPRTISVDPFATQVSGLHFFALFLFLGSALILLDSASRLRRLVSVLLFFGFIYAFFAILQSVLSPDKIFGIYGREGAQPFGSFVNRHNFAAFMEMMIAVPLGLVAAGGIIKDKRLLYLTAVGLMGVSLLLSGSRGGLVALLVEIILLVLLTAGSHGRHKLAMRFALVTLLVAAIVGGSFFVGGESSLTRIADTAKTADLTTGRAQIWQHTLKVIGANMPFGAGFGAFGVAYTPFDSLSGLERVEQAHNDYLQVLADAGLIGLLIGGFFLAVLFRRAVGLNSIENDYRRGVAIGAFSGTFAVLVHSIFDFVLHTTAVSLAFLTLVALFSVSFFPYPDDSENVGENRRRQHRKHRSRSVVNLKEHRSN